MKCHELELEALPYLDGKLSLPAREAVERHLRSCSACRERLDGFSGVSGLLDEWRGIEPSPFFNARLEQRIDRETPKGWFDALMGRLLPAPVSNPVFAMALLAVVVVGAVLIGYSPRSSQTPSAAPNTAGDIEEPPVVVALASGNVDEVALYRDLPVLEDWEVLRNFEVLQELSSTHR